jgi:hypothetical protein
LAAIVVCEITIVRPAVREKVLDGGLELPRNGAEPIGAEFPNGTEASTDKGIGRDAFLAKLESLAWFDQGETLRVVGQVQKDARSRRDALGMGHGG